MNGTRNSTSAGPEELVDWWRGLAPVGRPRVASAVLFAGAGILAGYLLGTRHLRLLALAHARSHPNDLETKPGLWPMDPAPHIWPYLLGGAVVGVLMSLLVTPIPGRLPSCAGH